MGVTTDAVLLYGIPIPDDHVCRAYGNEEYLDVVLKDHPGVGHASCGPYDQDTRYIVTDYHQAECNRYSVGGPVIVEPFDKVGTAERNARLEHAAMDLKLGDHPAPAWYLIADQN